MHYTVQVFSATIVLLDHWGISTYCFLLGMQLVTLNSFSANGKEWTNIESGKWKLTNEENINND